MGAWARCLHCHDVSDSFRHSNRGFATMRSRARIHAGLFKLFCLISASTIPLHVAAQSRPVSAPAPAPPPTTSPRELAPAAASGVVNLNTASSDELERLPGIGPSRARAILELRMRLKRFERIEDLLRVKGIGRATFRRLRPLVTLEGPTTLRQ
jgi:competence ComEA-like helix-hairpin-helix protein